MISVCVNTCALGADAVLRSSQGYGRPYGDRADLLRNVILPSLRADALISEIIVAGEWEEGEGYTYVHAPGPDHNVWDQCVQKHAAVEVATGDILVFLCDDHILKEDFTLRLKMGWSRNRLWDILSPERWHAGRRIATGWSEGYIHAHCIVTTKEALDVVSWMDVFKAVRGTWGWDVPATKLWREKGLRIMTDYELGVGDVENNPLMEKEMGR